MEGVKLEALGLQSEGAWTRIKVEEGGGAECGGGGKVQEGVELKKLVEQF